MRFNIATASTGYCPAADSAESMTASAPSKIAVATSDTSARVGTGLPIIDSSIWVATTTGLPARRAVRVSCFWMPGTFSSGISTPRSPRATISASVRSRMSPIRPTACGFSILAITPARPRVIFFASAMSSGRWMNDNPTQSMPASSPASRSERSFAVSAENAIVVSGRLTPLRFDSLPPTSTRATTRAAPVSIAVSRTLPSSSSSVWPGWSAARISGCGSCTRSALPGAGSESSAKVAPFVSMTASPAKVPMRSFGPCRSRRMPIDRPYSFSTLRMAATSARILSCAVWLMLMRKTSAPASNNCAITVCSDEAGPSVATILVRRSRLMPGSVPPPRAGEGRVGACAGRSSRLWPRLDRGRRRRDALGRRGDQRRERRQRPLRRLLGRLGELHRPRTLLAGVHLEEPGLLEAAGEAVLDAADGELLVARAHEGLPRPFAAAVVVDRVDIIEAGDERALEQRVAAARRQVPPPLGGPAVAVLVADGDADAASGVVAEAEIGRHRHCGGEDRRQGQTAQQGRGSAATPISPGERPGHRAMAGRILGGRAFRAGYHALRPVNEDGAEVVDVGPGRSRAQEVAQPLEKSGRVVVGKKGGRIEAKGAGALRAPRYAVERQRQGQREFLIGAPASVTADRNRQLAARQDHRAPAAGGSL